jgi:hypothetical protein
MSRTTDKLLSIELTSMKLRDAERSRDMEDSLHANKTALATKTAEVMAGVDNRWNILHAARFLGGAACSAQELWSQASAIIGINGHPPLSNYDMTHVNESRLCLQTEFWDKVQTDVGLDPHYT